MPDNVCCIKCLVRLGHAPVFYQKDAMREEGEALRCTVPPFVSDKPPSPLLCVSVDHCVRRCYGLGMLLIMKCVQNAVTKDINFGIFISQEPTNDSHWALPTGCLPCSMVSSPVRRGCSISSYSKLYSLPLTFTMS